MEVTGCMDQGEKGTGAIPKVVITKSGLVVKRPELYTPEIMRREISSERKRKTSKMATSQTSQEQDKIREEIKREQLKRKIDEENIQAQLRWHELK